MESPEPDKRTFRSYIIFWTGQLASLAGTNIVNFSLTWWITVQTGSALFLGISAFFAFGSFILITPIAGVLVDRWSRKKVIIVADSLLALLSFILVILFYIGVTLVALIARIAGKRFLALGFQPALESYWERREKPDRGNERYESQF